MINEDQTGLPQHFLMVLVEEHNFFFVVLWCSSNFGNKYLKKGLPLLQKECLK